MSNVAEKDREQMAKLLDEVAHTRSHEALAIALEAAYCVGRSTGFAECGEMTRALLVAPSRASLSEGHDHG